MFKVVKKAPVSPGRATAQRIGAVVMALFAAAILMALLGYNPLKIFSTIIIGATGTEYRIIETINKTIPLVVLSLGIMVAFKMKFWNIGAEGQFYIGAFAASLVAFNFPELPAIVLLPMMMVAAFIGGGFWCFIPGILKAKFGTNETLVTLMLNYVAIRWVAYLKFGPWKDPNAMGFPTIAPFSESAILPDLFGVHIGWLIALVLIVLVHILFRYTKLGYEIEVLGESEATARYAGMNVKKIMLIAVVISGGLCGFAGMMQASAIENTLTDTLSGGIGFTAIITTWLARLSAPMVLIVSILFAILLQGASYLQSAMQIPVAVSSLLQGIILFFVLGSEFFSQYSIVTRKRFEKIATEKKGGKR